MVEIIYTCACITVNKEKVSTAKQYNIGILQMEICKYYTNSQITHAYDYRILHYQLVVVIP